MQSAARRKPANRRERPKAFERDLESVLKADLDYWCACVAPWKHAVEVFNTVHGPSAVAFADATTFFFLFAHAHIPDG
jgi:hypothetical protein